MAGVLIAAWLWDRDWPVSVRWSWLLVFMAYLLAGSYLWSALGENVYRRYLVGLPLAALCVGLLAWQNRVWSRAPLTRTAWMSLLGIGTLLAMFPFSALNLQALSEAELRWGAAVLAVVLLSLAVGSLHLSKWLYLNLLPTFAFWWWGQDHAWGLYGALAAGALLTTGVWVAESRSERFYPSLLAALTCLLMTLSAPVHAVSLLAFGWGVTVFFCWCPQAHQRVAALVLAAVMLVAARYGLFDLYAYADSPVPVYLLKHLDLAAAYLGDTSRSISGAGLMVVLKIWLAGLVLVGIPMAFKHWRLRLDDVMALAAMCLLVQVGQASIRASLAVNALSYQYDFAEFSMLIHTGILVFGMLAYWAMRRVAK
jgi:hypothetical protein